MENNEENTNPQTPLGEDEEIVSAPGTGIDTDGDGNANFVTQPDDEPPIAVHVDHPDDYKGKVKLSDAPGNVETKTLASKLVKGSGINQHFKDIMLKQIKNGQFYPPYDETFKKIKTAHDTDTIYRPGSEGL